MPRNTSGNREKGKKSQKSSKGNAVKKTEQNDHKNTVRFKITLEYGLLTLMVVVLALLLFVGPFQRGLFFPRELLTAQIFIFALLIIWGFVRLLKKEGLKFNSPLDICLLVLGVAYFISYFVAAHKRDALAEILKITSYLIIYLAVIDISRYYYLPWQKKLFHGEQSGVDQAGSPGLRIILNLLLASAVAVAVGGIGVPAGNWDFIGAYDGARMASPIAYANAAAAYFMAAYLLAIALIPLASKRIRPVYLAAAVLLLMTVILTFSRGAWLLLIPLGLLLIIVTAPGERLRSLLYLILTAFTAVPFAFIVDSIFQTEDPARAWTMVAVAIILAVLLGFLVELYLSQSKKVRFYVNGFGMALLLLLIIFTVVNPALAPIHLARSTAEPVVMNSVQQVINNVEAGETYQLFLEVNARREYRQGLEKAEYVWGIMVLGVTSTFEYIELFNHRGDETEDWQKMIFSFNTTDDTNHLEIRLYNEYPGTSFEARSVILETKGKQQKLGFVPNRILPSRLYYRIYSPFRDRNIDRRFELFNDAIKVIKDRPLLGTGGGGWAAVYRSYQEHLYHSREIHNHFLQVWVEAGIFGFLAFIGIWISIIIAFIRNCLQGRASPRMWQLWTSVTVPIVALGAHSTIDWNFSMAAVGIYLFVLLGAARSLDSVKWFNRLPQNEKRPGRGNLIAGIIGVIAGTSLLIFTIMLLNGLNATWRSQDLIESNNFKQAASEMEKAIRLDPLMAENYYNLSVLMLEQFNLSGNPADLDRSINHAQKAQALEPYNPLYSYHLGVLLLRYVGIDEGFYYVDRVIEINPFLTSGYIQAVRLRLELADYLLELGDRRQAMNYLRQILDFEQLMEDNLGDSKPLLFYLGRANHLLNNFDAAVKYYQEVPENSDYYSRSQRHLKEILGDD